MTPAGIDGRVNVALIPSVEERNLSRATLEAVKRFFEVPQNRAPPLSGGKNDKPKTNKEVAPND